MLYILDDKDSVIATWHVGEKLSIENLILPKVVTFQADGDELEFLIHVMTK